MLIKKKLKKQCTPCPSASTMILQTGIAISLEGRHLVLTLLASMEIILGKFCILNPKDFRVIHR